MRRLPILASLFVLGLALTPMRARLQQDPPKQDPPKTEQNQDDVIKVSTNLVVVNVTVTDFQDRYVSGLKRENFSLLEDNQPQMITDVTLEETPFAAAILIDISGSMQQKLALARSACARFVDGIRIGDVFAIYSFSGMKVKMLQDFTEVRDLPDGIWDMRPDGETPLYDAIVKAGEALAKRAERRRAILLLSDGADTKSKATLEQALRQTAVAQAAIYAVDMTDRAVYGATPRDNGADILKTLAEKTGGKFFSTPGGSQLRDALAQTVEELRNQYTLTYEPIVERLDGRWHTIQVRLDKPALKVRARPGYYANKKKNSA